MKHEDELEPAELEKARGAGIGTSPGVVNPIQNGILPTTTVTNAIVLDIR